MINIYALECMLRQRSTLLLLTKRYLLVGFKQNGIMTFGPTDKYGWRQDLIDHCWDILEETTMA